MCQIGLCAVAIVCFFILSAASIKKGNPASGDFDSTIWDVLKLGNKPIVNSYLFSPSKNNNSNNNNYVKFVQDIVDIIHMKQNLPREKCSRSRLMLLQMPSTSFDGTGGLLKQIILSTAVSIHSNRTLIWGLGFPAMFEHSREVWGADDVDRVVINNEVLNCTQSDMGAGAFGCFFEPLSTCSLEDAYPDELMAISDNPYNETARLILSESRKGIALYHPPAGLFEHIFRERKYSSKYQKEILRRKSHLWAAAVAAYVFRLKENLLTSFYQKYPKIASNDKNHKTNITTWGMHVRHGDLKALPNTDWNKKDFEFEDFFSAALQLSHNVQSSPNQIFIATDSLEADKLPKLFAQFMQNTRQERQLKEEDDGDDFEDYYDTEEDGDEKGEKQEQRRDNNDDKQHQGWLNTEKVPQILTINNAHRYRTLHGSHTVATNGGCVARDNNEATTTSRQAMHCILPYEIKFQYLIMDEHRTVSRAMRIMRVLLESIEDLFLLSYSDRFFGSGSSHFSTVAALLILARSGVKEIKDIKDIIIFLDEAAIGEGITPTAFLYADVIPSLLDEEMKQWQVLHTSHFMTGVKGGHGANIAKYYSAASISATSSSFSSRSSLAWMQPRNYITLINSLPQFPDDTLFYYEAKTWLATSYQPMLHGHCPELPQMLNGIDPVAYMTQTINLGVEHVMLSHTGQAIQCWSDALRFLEMILLTQKKQQKNQQRAATGVAVEAKVVEQLQEYGKLVEANKLSVRMMRYSDMVSNENHNVKEYLLSIDAFIQKKKSYLDNNNNEIVNAMNLEELNERIIKLQHELKQMEGIHDSLFANHQDVDDNDDNSVIYLYSI